MQEQTIISCPFLLRNLTAVTEPAPPGTPGPDTSSTLVPAVTARRLLLATPGLTALTAAKLFKASCATVHT